VGPQHFQRLDKVVHHHLHQQSLHHQSPKMKHVIQTHAKMAAHAEQIEAVVTSVFARSVSPEATVKRIYVQNAMCMRFAFEENVGAERDTLEMDMNASEMNAASVTTRLVA